MTVTLTAPAKLTLSLRVTGVRPDGYHTLEVEMVSLDLHDTLEITSAEQNTLEVVGGANDIPTDDSNIVMRALRLAEKHAHIKLVKNIPSQAGLGGGSADAGAVLRWAQFTDLEAASRIGADVPFCINGGRALVSGIGEKLKPLPFQRQSFTLLTPPLQCSTKAVFARWDQLGGPTGEYDNDLEPAVIDLVPEMAIWRDKLHEITGVRPTLAGSGSTWFVEGSFTGEGLQTYTTVDKQIAHTSSSASGLS